MIMTNTNITILNDELILTKNKTVKVFEEQNPALLTKMEWVTKNQTRLPPFWADDYSMMVNEFYHLYMLNSQFYVEQHQQDILLTDTTTKKNAFFSQILITLQTTPIEYEMHLVLRVSEGDEVSLCSLKDIDESFDPLQHFVSQQIDFAQALNKRISNFCLPVGQHLILRIKGGVFLKENILVRAKYV